MDLIYTRACTCDGSVAASSLVDTQNQNYSRVPFWTQRPSGFSRHRPPDSTIAGPPSDVQRCSNRDNTENEKRFTHPVCGYILKHIGFGLLFTHNQSFRMHILKLRFYIPSRGLKLVTTGFLFVSTFLCSKLAVIASLIFVYSL